jgi:predicted acetyltransferase
MIELVLPSSRYRTSYLDALAEYHAEGAYPSSSEVIASRGFDAFVAELHALSDPASAPPGYVPRTTWWLVEGDRYLGRLAIRHGLNDALRAWGGHISYDIRPTERGKGLGTPQLKLGLVKARTLGLERVLVMCDDTNIRSARVIEANGGILEDVIDSPDGEDEGNGPFRIRRYWIAL